jgi:ATP synthase F0, A subunit
MTHRIKYKLLLFFALAFSLFLPKTAFASTEEHKGEINVSEFVLEHLADSYEWHITTWGDHHISIPLPVIVRGQTSGWQVFSSERIKEAAKEGKDYQGFFFSPEHHNKIYERLPNGEIVKPWDISITKNVIEIWLVVFILLTVFLTCARWYKKHDSVRQEAPKGFVGMIEMLVMAIHDDVIKSSIGEKHHRRYAPYLLTVFFFIFTNNLLGLIPIFPGGANVTGNINITLFLAVGTMLMVNLFGNKEYWKEILWPNVPLWLKIPPVMPVIEIFGIFTKPFALMIRLFANMMAGHAIILSFTFVIFMTWQISTTMGSIFTVFSSLLMIFLNCLELLVAFLQAYVFTLLSSVFIGLSLPEHHED